MINDKTYFEVVLWHLPNPVPGSMHPFKYWLAFVVNGECVLRYDNERGKGDHRHLGNREEPIEFTSLEALYDAFQADMERMLR
ncbi:toxin-antitoxin system TumE family protein|uniref:toxin-antitoxin system TumE family protein n=1 Tax=Rhizobium altiplani TaxID=1864509 RepID=UPI0026A9D7E5